jgi:hypothetical protein
MADAKKSAGEIAIEASLKPGSSNAAFLKALWSIRGDLKVRMGARMVPVVKAALVNELKLADGDKPSNLLLVKSGDGYEVQERRVKVKEPEVQAS